jgi:hypothetical protein
VYLEKEKLAIHHVAKELPVVKIMYLGGKRQNKLKFEWSTAYNRSCLSDHEVL